MRKLGTVSLMLCFFAFTAWADSLELKNGSLIKGKYMGGDQTSVSFQVGSSVQKYNTTDILSLTFDSSAATQATAPRLAPAVATRSLSSTDEGPMLVDRTAPTASSAPFADTVTVPAGTM